MNYYLNHGLPIILVVLSGDFGTGSWVEFDINRVNRSTSGWWSEIPERNRIDHGVVGPWSRIAGEVEDHAESIQMMWAVDEILASTDYRAFAIPDMRLSPFLEKGDIVVGYRIEDKHTLVPMSYYVFVTEKRIVFGMISMIIPDKEISVVENPLMQRPIDYAWDAILECWMVDKLITDNFVSRFRYMQMILQNIGGGTPNTEKF